MVLSLIFLGVEGSASTSRGFIRNLYKRNDGSSSNIYTGGGEGFVSDMEPSFSDDGEGFVSDICRSRDGSSAYTGGGEGFVPDICRSRDGSPAYTGGGEGYSFPKIDPGIPETRFTQANMVIVAP